MRSYASYTFDSPNPLKRLIHRNRLPGIISKTPLPKEGPILDYGSGDGRLFRFLVDGGMVPPSRLVAFDPAPAMEEQFSALVPEVRFERDLDRLLSIGQFEAIFCLEVFEHLTRPQTETAIDALRKLLSPTGTPIVEVPIELGPPGFLKNLYRRHLGGVDIPYGLMLKSLLGIRVEREPRQRPGGGIAFEHPGFAYQQTAEDLGRFFRIERKYNTPFVGLPALVNNVRVMTFRHR